MIEKLEKLHKDIWKIHRNPDPRSPYKYWSEESREITPDELNMVAKIVVEERLGMKLHNSCMGFNVGVTIYSNPVYPGIDSESILTITGQHLNKKFNDAWEVFYPFCKLHEDLMLEPIQDKWYYDY